MKEALSPEAAAELIPDGARIMIGGFMGVGAPRRMIDALVISGTTDLRLTANVTAMRGQGTGNLIAARAIRRLSVSHIGPNPETQRQMNDGSLDADLMPPGTLIECIRARRMRPGAFVTPAGLGAGQADTGDRQQTAFDERHRKDRQRMQPATDVKQTDGPLGHGFGRIRGRPIPSDPEGNCP